MSKEEVTANKTWNTSQGKSFLVEISDTHKNLKNEVYTLMLHPKSGFYLEHFAEKFTFNFQVFGLEQEFIERVVKFYHNSKDNLGVLLNGVKGTGKTVTAQTLANAFKLPVILVNQSFGTAGSEFLASIDEEVIIFVDEYEKIFQRDEDGNYDYTLLSLMDGILKTKTRKIFLFTTNNLFVNDNLLNRPGRIRYRKQFEDLSKKQIEEIIDACLVRKKYKGEIIAYLKHSRLITVDIVKAIITEVDLFDKSPFELGVDLNIEENDEVLNAYELGKDNELSPLKMNLSSALFDTFASAKYLRIPAEDISKKVRIVDGDYHYRYEKPYEALVNSYHLKAYYKDEFVRDLVVVFKFESPVHYAYSGIYDKEEDDFNF